jgi:tetratricopeptide (TPR) repeat protein
MPSKSGNFVKIFCAALCLFFSAAFAHSCLVELKIPDGAKSAFDAGDYPKAIEILNRAAAASPHDAAIQHLLAHCYFESDQFDRAIPPAEASVAVEPKNSAYHDLLGRAYGEKANRSSWFGGLSLAKKARKEFETAVQLDDHNFAAFQALIEYDCSAPAIANGGEDKARPEIARLSAIDAAEGHYAEGNCRRQKKDFSAVDAEFRKALALHPKSADLIFDIGDYYAKRNQADGLAFVVKESDDVASGDPRAPFYHAVLLVLQKQNSADAAQAIRQYIATAPKRANYPSKAMAHYWLGRIEENQGGAASAKKEYQEALNLEPKNRYANEAMKRLRDN